MILTPDTFQSALTAVSEVNVDCITQFTGCFKAQSGDAIVASVSANTATRTTQHQIGTVVGNLPFSVCRIDKRARLAAFKAYRSRAGNMISQPQFSLVGISKLVSVQIATRKLEGCILNLI
jgi:hypothetical protein